MQPSCNPFPAPPGNIPLVLLTHEYAPFRGGAAIYVQEIASAAREAGYAVEVWTVDYRNRLNDREQQNFRDDDSSRTFPVVRLPANGRLTPGGLLKLAWGLYRRRKQLQASSVILLSVGAQMVFFVFDLFGIVSAQRTTVFFYGSELLRFGGSWMWRWLARRFYARARAFAVLTRPIERLARESGLLPSGAEIVLAPPALPSAFVRRSNGVETTKMFHVEHEDKVMNRVLTVARLHPRKGQLEVARALALLPATLREQVIYQMIGIGEDDYRSEVQVACREGGIRYEFLGALDDNALREMYGHATIYVQASVTLPNSIEGFGISFLEASFHGCPVVAYRSGGVEEAVIEGQTGFMVTEGDRVSLAAAVIRLLDDPALRERMGESGKRFAQTFSWEKSARILCEVARRVGP